MDGEFHAGTVGQDKGERGDREDSGESVVILLDLEVAVGAACIDGVHRAVEDGCFDREDGGVEVFMRGHGSSAFIQEFLGAFGGLIDGADVGEGLFGPVVALAVDDLFETFDGVLARDILAFEAGVGFRDEHGLA